MQSIRNLVLVCCATFLAACSGGSSTGAGGSGTIDLQVTDAPFEYDIVTAANVSVDKITIFHNAQSESGPIVLYEGAPILMDLFNLRDGLTQQLGQSTLPVGTYRQLRLRVTHAELTLTNGNHYTTDDDTIRLTSQGTSGFKVFIDPPIDIERDTTRNVLLDFDLTHTFQPVPGNDALTANFYHLHPVIHVTNLGHVGGVTGTITQDDGQGGLLPVASATVYVLPAGQTDTTLAVATTGTSATGTYTVLAVAPGTYDVYAVKGELSALGAGITITPGEVTHVDLTLGDGTGMLAGSVTQDNGSGGLAPVEGATVYVLLPGQSDPNQAVLSGLTGVDGSYSLPGLLAGPYDVLAVKGALSALTTGVAIVAGSTAQVDLTIH